MRGGSPVMQIRLRTPARVRAQQLRLDAEDVAVAAAEVVHRLDAGLLLDQLAGDLRAHAGAGARTVGNVDAVDARARRSGARRRFRATHPRRAAAESRRTRRTCPAASLAPSLRLLRHRHRRQRLRLDLRLLHRDRQLLLRRLQRARFRADQLDVLRRGAAAAADDLDAGPQQAARVLRHVLGRAQIDVAAFDRAWAGRRSAWRSSACWRTASCARRFRAWPSGPPSSSAR